MSEWETNIAKREAASNISEDRYFATRPLIKDTALNHQLFSAGFQRGWDVKKATFRMSDKRITEIAESMPGGIDGFLKGWGWRQFARDIEAEHKIGE